jgi:hypothetical protein
MKASLVTALMLSAFAAVIAASPARADADDIKWIGQCVVDNKDEGQTVAVVTAYCTCMNDQMSSSESRSITQWEKTHKREENMCAAKAGWKGK